MTVRRPTSPRGRGTPRRGQRVSGPAHVADGSDFDGTDGIPSGLESADLLPNLTAELLARGRGEAELAGILGGNYLPVFEAVFSPPTVTDS